MITFKNEATRRILNVTSSLAVSAALLGTSVPAAAIANEIKNSDKNTINHENSADVASKPKTKSEAFKQLDDAQKLAVQKETVLSSAKKELSENTAKLDDMLAAKKAADTKYTEAEKNADKAFKKIEADAASMVNSAVKGVDEAASQKQDAQAALDSAKQEQEKANTAVEDAQKALDAAKAEAGEDAVATLEQAQKDFDQAQKDKLAAQEGLKSADKALDAAKNKYNAAVEVAESKAQQLNIAQDNLSVATANKQTAQAQLDKAQAALDDAIAQVDEQAIKDAEKLVQETKADVEAKKAEVATCQSNIDAITAVKADADKVVSESKAEVEKANKKLEDAKSNQVDAQAKYDKAVANKNSLVKDKNSASAKVDKLKQDLAQADKNIVSAKENLAEKQTALNKAQDGVTAAEKAADQADQNLKDGAFAFFKDLADKGDEGAEAALDALNTCKYKDFIKKGEEGDATSIKNIKQAFGYIREANRLRKEYHNIDTPLQISHKYMAYAMANADWSALNIDHARQFSCAENAAWGSDPFFSWYWVEKVVFYEQKGMKLTPDLEKVKENWIYKYYEKNNMLGQTGHYINLINPDHTQTGFGICNRPGTEMKIAFIQDFDQGWSSEKSYSVDEYEKMFDAWVEKQKNPQNAINEAKNQLTQAQKDVDAAKQGITEAEQNRSVINTSLINAQSEVAGLEKQIDNATQNINQANNDLETSKAAVVDATAAKKSSDQKLSEALEKLDVVDSKLVAANANLDSANSNLDKSTKQYEAAKKELARLLDDSIIKNLTSLRDEAQTNLDKATEKFNKAEGAKDKAQKESDEAVKVVADAESKVSQKTKEQVEAKDKFNTAVEVASKSKKNLDEILAKNESLREAQKNLENVVAVKQSKDNAVVKAEEVLAVKKQAVIAAEDKKDEAEAAYTKAKAIAQTYKGIDTPQVTDTHYANLNDVIEALKALHVNVIDAKAALDTAKTNVENTQVKVNNAEADLAEALAEVAIAKANLDWFNFEVVKGAEQKVVQGDSCSFKINADVNEFESVKVDGEIIDLSNYLITSPSTIVTFKKGYLKSLSTGVHTLEVLYKNEGSATTTFTVVKKEVPINTKGDASKHIKNDKSKKTATPSTGDIASMYPAVMALMGTVAIADSKRRNAKHFK